MRRAYAQDYFYSSERLGGRIDFPLSLNMLPYTTKANHRKAGKSTYIYDLASAVLHQAKLDAGHYYGYSSNRSKYPL
jgi:ubiquitin carboxyl-terminal hydrolase 22/27/51